MPLAHTKRGWVDRSRRPSPIRVISRLPACNVAPFPFLDRVETSRGHQRGKPMHWTFRVLSSVWLLLSGMVVADEKIRPYEADEFTLHLWHLNEGAPPFENSVK